MTGLGIVGCTLQGILSAGFWSLELPSSRFYFGGGGAVVFLSKASLESKFLKGAYVGDDIEDYIGEHYRGY